MALSSNPHEREIAQAAIVLGKIVEGIIRINDVV
jgi:hypothetical protein